MSNFTLLICAILGSFLLTTVAELRASDLTTLRAAIHKLTIAPRGLEEIVTQGSRRGFTPAMRTSRGRSVSGRGRKRRPGSPQTLPAVDKLLEDLGAVRVWVAPLLD